MIQTFVLGAVALASLLGGVATAASQEASPVADERTGSGGAYEVAPPRDCTVAPRPVEDFAVPAGTPTPRQGSAGVDEAALPGTPADPATVEAITAVAREFTACLNAGDYRRLAALMTDDAFSGWLLEDGIADADEVIARLLTTPTPPPANEQIAVDVRGVRLLPDGRVGAVVDWCSEANFDIYERVGDRWLVDDEFGVTVAETEMSCTVGATGTAEP